MIITSCVLVCMSKCRCQRCLDEQLPSAGPLESAESAAHLSVVDPGSETETHLAAILTHGSEQLFKQVCALTPRTHSLLMSVQGCRWRQSAVQLGLAHVRVHESTMLTMKLRSRELTATSQRSPLSLRPPAG